MLHAQGSSRLNPIPNVYLDCSACDITYIRSNISFVNYVRDQDDATIYLLINDQRTAGGGREYNLIFSELGVNNPRSDTLRYVSSSTDSSDERRIGLNRYIKIGLIPFVTHTVAIQALDVFYEQPDVTAQEGEEIDDPWNNWVFDVNLRSNMSGQAREFNFGLYSGFEAERTTEIWKIRGRVRGEVRRRNVELTDRTLNVNRDWGNYWGMAAYSVSDHFSIGVFNGMNFNRSNNIALSAYIAPAVEYNFFPYSEFQQRRFVVQYQISPQFRRYYNTTIFLKDSELIMAHEVSGQLRYDQRWGRIDIRVSGSHFFHDTSINRISFNPSFNIRVMRGFSVSISGSYRIINDQLSLELPTGVDPNDPISIIEGVQRPTSYDYSFSFGLSYTFGSIYNNVVNSRF
ncbi:MAG: hypothetical protein WDZ38_04965 [Balneolaceae bacterium]